MIEQVMIATILLLPLLSGLFSLILPTSSSKWTSAGLLVSLLLSIYLLVGYHSPLLIQWEWIPNIQVGIIIDRIALILISLVLLISLLVNLFSVEYMKGDKGIQRYYAKLGFFVFSMIGLLMADHLIMLFLFWELVGVASYLLIGFWFSKGGVPASARIAFMVNRVADASLLVGILMLNKSAESLFMSEMDTGFLLLPSLLIAIGAFGKSAQFPFSGWLTKAMVGPTPISALIHAATMVAAGVYLLFRVGPYLHENALMLIALTGGFTALYGGISAINQHDIKKVLAYSTISQLGYMMIGIGVGAFNVALFHLFTHAFFKAGLFLGAASIIHYLHKNASIDPQDMRNMGGLKRVLPWTYRSFIVCGLALAGIPLFSGFISKEGIIVASWMWANEQDAWAYLIPDLALVSVLLTAFYVGRLILLVFYGSTKSQSMTSNELEVNWLKVPLILLALGSLWFFYSLNPIGHNPWMLRFFGEYSMAYDWLIGATVTGLSIFLAVAGLTLAYSFFKSDSNYANNYHEMGTPSSIAGRIIYEGGYLTTLYERLGGYCFLVAKQMGQWDHKVIDTILHFIGIAGVVLAKMLALVDRFLVDGPVNWVASFSAFLGKRFAGLSARDIQLQLIWLLVAVILILGWFILF